MAQMEIDLSRKNRARNLIMSGGECRGERP